MNRFFYYLLAALFFLFPVCAQSAETGSTSEPLPELSFTIPANDYYIEYLGLEGSAGDQFSLSDIKADIVLIELFSMYCPFCQKEAPLVNELFEKMQEKSKSGIKVKIIGLGASNTQFEVEHFRDTYNVPFPLFPDHDMAKYKALKGAGTPGFIGCSLKGNTPLIVLRNSGGFYSSDDFLAELIKNSGL